MGKYGIHISVEELRIWSQLEAAARAGRWLTPPELCAAAHVTRTTARKHLRQLTALGLAAQEGTGYQAQRPITPVGQAYLRLMAHARGEAT